MIRHYSVLYINSEDVPGINLTISGYIIDRASGDSNISNGILLNNIQDSIVTDNIINVPSGSTTINRQGTTSVYENNNIETYF